MGGYHDFIVGYSVLRIILSLLLGDIMSTLESVHLASIEFNWSEKVIFPLIR